MSAEPVGFRNLGNSCYMNATLQALAAAEPWRAYFDAGEAVHDVNSTSKFGAQGKLAVAYHDLLQSLTIATKAVSPTKFKEVLVANK